MSLKKLFIVISLVGLFFIGNSLEAFDVTYRAYVAGWQAWVFDGQTSGTIGYKLEAVQILLNTTYLPLDVEYRTYVSGSGWQAWVTGGNTSGITGQNKQISAIEIRLLNSNPGNTIKYRVYDSKDGWLPWMFNGQTAGYDSRGKRSDAYEVKYFESIICSTPPYYPTYWNDNGIIQKNNNCYNYSNNRRTDTFAQPGRAGGDMYSSIDCLEVSNGAIADGLESTTADAIPPDGKTKIAMVIWPGTDYHWYRQDSNGLWTHKPGSTAATNLDNSGNIITNPETADRGNYTIFCGYFLTCSNVNQGEGNANIR